MVQRLQTPNRAYDLERYPVSTDPTLRAWDAADEYLLRHLEDEAGDLSQHRLLLVNDAFGALAVALHAQGPSSWGDSFLSWQALKANLDLNDLPPDHVPFTGADQIPEGPFDLVLLKIPKSMAYLEDLLLRLRPVLAPQALVISGSMVKHTPGRAYALLGQCLGPTQTSLGWKKARLAITHLDPDLKLPTALPQLTYDLPGFDLTLNNSANVFSRQHLDIGTRFLLPHLPRSDQRCQMADLGCGNGALSLALAQLNPQAHILGVDESYQAVACARTNAHTAGLGPDRVTFQVGDGLRNEAADSLDFVVCNPPFHQAQTMDGSVAVDMFAQAHRVLRPGAILLIVGNRHLGYHVRLRELFGEAMMMDMGPKFVVLQAHKGAI